MIEDVERALLSCAFLYDDTAPIVLRDLARSDFLSESNGRIFEAMRQLYDESKTLDPESLRLGVLDPVLIVERLRGAVPVQYVAGITDAMGDKAALEYYVNAIKAESARRRYRAHLVASHLETSEFTDVESDLMDSAKKIEAIAHSSRVRKITAACDGMDTILADVKELMTYGGGLSGISSGISSINRSTGGFGQGELITIAARTGFGKTSIALNMSKLITVDSGKSALYCSLEMSAKQLRMRLLCSMAGISSLKARQGKITQWEVDALRAAAVKLEGIPLFLDDNPSLSVNALEALAARIKNERGLDVIFVDYLQLMSNDGRVENRTQAVSAISRGLKCLAMRLQLPIVALSQLSRNADQLGRRPRLSDLRESGSIEQDSDVVVFLHRADDQDGRNGYDTDVIVAKNRNGPQSEFQMKFDPLTTTFIDVRQL